jgi:hypothetical protein
MFRMDAVDNKVATTYDMQESCKYHIFCSKWYKTLNITISDTKGYIEIQTQRLWITNFTNSRFCGSLGTVNVFSTFSMQGSGSPLKVDYTYGKSNMGLQRRE